jgi:lipopolysaccharide export system permease protein
MKILQRYILREHVGPLIFSLAALTSLLLLNQVAKQFGNLVGKGLAWSVIGEFFLLSVPFIIAMTLPMAVLVSTLYAFSRLAAENEITALKASGVGLWRIIRPVLVGATGISLILLAFNDQVLPRSNHRLRKLQGDIARTKPTFALKEQIINEVSPGKLFLRAGHIDEGSDRLREITIYDMSDPSRRRSIFADSGRMRLAANRQDLELTLYDGFSQEVPRENGAELQRLFYEVDVIRVRGVANSFDRTENDTYKSDREMSICEMQQVVQENAVNLAAARTELAEAMRATVRRLATGESRTVSAPDSSARVRTLGAVYCRYILPALGVRTAVAAPPPAGALVPAPAPQGSSGTPQGVPRPVRPDSALAARRAAAARGTIRKIEPPRTAAQGAGKQGAGTQGAGTQWTRKSGTAPRADSAGPPRPLPFTVPAIREQAERARAGMARAEPSPRDRLRAGGARVDSAARTRDPRALANPAAGASAAPVPDAPVAMPRAPITAAALGAQIESAISRMEQSRSDLSQYEVEIQKKFALAAACVVFVLLGAPIALRFPRGGVGLVIGVSLVVFALYYVGLIAGETLADKLILSPFWAMWMANVLFTAVGIFFLHRVRKTGSTARGGDASEMLDAVRAWLGRQARRVGIPLERRRQVTAS